MAILDAKSSKVTALGNTYLFGSTIKESVAKSSLATFADGGDKYPMLSLTGYINPVQTGSGDPSPSNVRPITGWTGMNIVRTGKNLCPTATITLGNGSPRTVDVYFAKPLPIGTYTFSASVTTNTSANANPGVQFFTLNSNAGSVTAPIGTTGTITKTITVTAPLLRLYFYIGTTDYNNGKTIVFENIQIEVGSTATTYEPYNGTTYPISWADEAGTVYGGYLDVVTGVLTVDKASVDLGGQNRSWSKYTNGNNWGFYTDITGGVHFTTGSVVNALCSHFKVVSPVVGAAEFIAGEDNTITGNGGSSGCRFIVKCTAYSDAAAFKTAMSGAYLVYKLATPKTYQLTPTEVLSILGTNNVWCDTGEIEATYIADTKLYIDSKL